MQPRSQPIPDGVVAALRDAAVTVVEDPDVLAGHSTDWTGRWSGPILAMARPRTTAQVAAVLAAAAAHRVPVQVQGGNTGLVGGSVPDRPCLLLLTGGLDHLDPVDISERTVLAGAGVPLARLSGHARSAGLHFGVDLAARDTATVGGLAATNAGGIGVCAFGMMRQNVRGVTAVLADGRVVSGVGRPMKDNTGYDLTDLLVGSEGTLGVITEVEVVLHPPTPATTVGLLAVPDLATAAAVARRVQGGAFRLLAAEVVDAQGVRRDARARGVTDPLPGGADWLLLLEVADGGSAEGLADVGDLVVAVGTEPADRAGLWAYREGQSELYARLPGGPVDKLDVSVRLADLDAAVARIRGAVAHAGRDDAPETWVGFFGHALDGNLHVQVVGGGSAAVASVLEVVAGLGGSISAEHGIGRLKAGYLGLARSAQEISWMRHIKAQLDPAGLLNPGVLFAD